MGVFYSLVLCAAISQSESQTLGMTYRVNCGGGAFVDSAGHFWEADRYFEGGSTFGVSDSIVGTGNQSLYNTERWGDPAQGNLRYVFNVREGEYKIRLHFAEIWDSAFVAGKRVFDVNVNGQAAAMELDVYARAGARTPLVIEYAAIPNEGRIAVEFFGKIHHAKVSGIEILPVNPFHADKAPYRIHCGGDDFIDTKGNFWESDGHFNGGSVYAAGKDISNTDMPMLYQTERFNYPNVENLAYAFEVEEGTYTVRLHFAEIFFANPGERVFGIDINGISVFEGLDIIAEAGANAALVKEFPAMAQEGKINIGFRNGIENAKISGIEILPAEPVRMRTPQAMVSGGNPVVAQEGPGSLAVHWPSAGRLTVTVSDPHGREIASRGGEGPQRLAGLKPGIHLVSIRSGRKVFSFLVPVF